MSAPSIAPFLPFRRVRIEGHRVEAEPAFAVVDLEPDRRYVSRCGRCGGQSRRVHSCYRRRVWDLSLEAHRVRLRLRVRRLRCASCAGVRSEGFDFVDPFVPASPGGWPATSATLGACFELMSEEERAAVEAVALDMWYPYIQAVRAWLPNARVVYGLYHVVADYHRRVLDRVRVAAYKEAETEEERRWIKGSRYLLFKNDESLTDRQRPHLKRLLEVNEAIHTAYLLRDSLKEIWKLRSPWAVRRAIKEWCEMAEVSGLEPLETFAGTLRRHRRGIAAHARYPISTGRLEGVNNKIKVIKRRSYGFRDPTYFTLKVKQAFPGS